MRSGSPALPEILIRFNSPAVLPCPHHLKFSVYLANSGSGGYDGLHTNRDPELDFNVLAHCFRGGAKSPPHDHGTSWAIYGQAIGHTNVEVWRRKEGAKGDKQHGHADLEKIDSYELNAGEAGVFHPGIVHTVEFTPGSRYIRLTEQRATWLLVYDNVPAPNQIADFLPSAGARVLITSRFSDWSELATEGRS